jgi:glucuronate isomerase
VSRALYEETRDLPIVSPHGHVDARILAENAAFPEPASLIVQPDHYILRLLYANGVPLEALLKDEPRRVWQLFAEHYYLFRGTPTGAWLDYELYELFAIGYRLSGDTAERAYDAIVEKLASPEFRPRARFERFNIEVLATTDAATDTLGTIARSRVRLEGPRHSDVPAGRAVQDFLARV